MTPVASVGLLMQTIIEPAADHYWDAVGSVTDEHGTTSFSPTSAEEWTELRNNGYVLAESGNLLMMEGRARDQGDWLRLARAMVEAGRQAAVAAEQRDTTAVFEAGSVVYQACSACHAAYLIPKATPPGATR
jgi:hypothetical protein